MRGIATFAALVLVAGAGSGCHRRSRGLIVGDAQASAASSTTSAARAAEAATARAFAGGDDDEDVGGSNAGEPGKGGGQGGNKWRDCGVYVDGRPVGVLAWGELPIGLKPTWKAEEHSIEFDYGYKGPRTRTSYERRYKFVDYLKAVGVDLAKIKELHVMGPKESEVLIATGKQLRSKAGQELMFRFGAVVGGKPIPVVPEGFGNGKHSDKIGAVMVYINKKPPVLVPDEGLALEGKLVDGIPYYGDPFRGGVRVYADDRLTLQIKRPMLREVPADVGADGKKRWSLWKLLEQKGIDTSKIVEAWAIADERRKQKFTRAELEKLTFELSDKGNNEILVGDGQLKVTALALHDHALKPDELPQIRPGEE